MQAPRPLRARLRRVESAPPVRAELLRRALRRAAQRWKVRGNPAIPQTIHKVSLRAPRALARIPSLAQGVPSSLRSQCSDDAAATTRATWATRLEVAAEILSRHGAVARRRDARRRRHARERASNGHKKVPKPLEDRVGGHHKGGTLRAGTKQHGHKAPFRLWRPQVRVEG